MKKNTFIYSSIFIAVNLVLSIFIITIVAADPAGASFYVSNDGDDGNSGLSPDQAWRTIAKVNAELDRGLIKQGDNIYFNRGDSWSENLGNGADCGLDIERGGTSDNWMIIGAYGTGSDPILENTDPSTTAAATISCDDNIGYIRIENLDIIGTDGVGYAEVYFTKIADYNHIIIDNVDITNGKHGIFLFRIRDFIVENCDISSVSDHGITVYGYNTGIKPCNGIIRNCNVNSLRDGISFHPGDGGETENIGNNFWVDNCRITGQTSEESMDIVGGIGSENYLIENCEIYNSRHVVIGHGASNVVFQNNFIHDNNLNGVVLTRCNNVIIRNNIIKDCGSKSAIQYNIPKTDEYKSLTIYNNNIINGGDNFYDMPSDQDIAKCYVKNNIFYGSIPSTSNSAFLRFVEGSTISNRNHYFSYNMWWRPDGLLAKHWYNGGDYLDWAGWIAIGNVDNEIRANPDMVNPTGDNLGKDFKLASGSPCIDAGGWLTKTKGGGTGKTITLNEANYFFGGISELDLNGDNIFVGDDTNLKVLNVDYSSKKITVDRSITWADGDIVSLSSYHGNAPDIGAFESLMSGPIDIIPESEDDILPIEPEPPITEPDTAPPEISNILLTESGPLDTDSSYGQIKITSEVTAEAEVSNVNLIVTNPDSSIVNISMKTGESNSYYYISSDLFSDYGSYSYYIWTIDLNGCQSTSGVYDFSMPPNWDVDENGVCNIYDFMLISNCFDETGPNGWIREDLDNNGIIQVLDFSQVSSHFGETWK